jgi:rod shape-determining protein MreD
LDLVQKNKFGIFIATLAAFLLLPTVSSSLHLFYFAPFLIIVYYQQTYSASLWASLGCGVIVDLFSAHLFFGINALAYTLASALLYGQRRNFFSDRATTLPLMTFFFSFLVTLIFFLISYFGEEKVLPSWNLISSDFLAMPIIDGFCAFAFFILPFQLFGPPRRKGRDYFMPA